MEAARAGEAGRGFAAVAGEVRNLANKSAKASKNTASLINGSLSAVKEGTLIADDTAKALHIAVEGVKQVIGNIDKISMASNEQADAIQQVTQGISQNFRCDTDKFRHSRGKRRCQRGTFSSGTGVKRSCRQI